MLSQQIFSLVLLLATGTVALEVGFWNQKDCHGFANDMGSRIIDPTDGCIVRGERAMQNELLGMPGGNVEQAIAVKAETIAEASQYAVFFSSEDCNPDNMIKDGFIDYGCAGGLKGWESNKIKDYKSFAVWDLCEGKPGCSLEEEVVETPQQTGEPLPVEEESRQQGEETNPTFVKSVKPVIEPGTVPNPVNPPAMV